MGGLAPGARITPQNMGFSKPFRGRALMIGCWAPGPPPPSRRAPTPKARRHLYGGRPVALPWRSHGPRPPWDRQASGAGAVPHLQASGWLVAGAVRGRQARPGAITVPKVDTALVVGRWNTRFWLARQSAMAPGGWPLPEIRDEPKVSQLGLAAATEYPVWIGRGLRQRDLSPRPQGLAPSGGAVSVVHLPGRQTPQPPSHLRLSASNRSAPIRAHSWNPWRSATEPNRPGGP